MQTRHYEIYEAAILDSYILMCIYYNRFYKNLKQQDQSEIRDAFHICLDEKSFYSRPNARTMLTDERFNLDLLVSTKHQIQSCPEKRENAYTKRNKQRCTLH